MRLQRSGASLKEIADLLGHEDLDATKIYAKVDLEGLRAVALPWPGRLQ
jgi:site-specific recombinase XerD